MYELTYTVDFDRSRACHVSEELDICQVHARVVRGLTVAMLCPISETEY